MIERRQTIKKKQSTDHLHDLYGSNVRPDVAVGVPPALKIDDGEELLLTSGDPVRR
jgi:hypothetical protein